jgi:hypothetical protein
MLLLERTLVKGFKSLGLRALNDGMPKRTLDQSVRDRFQMISFSNSKGGSAARRGRNHLRPL